MDAGVFTSPTIETINVFVAVKRAEKMPMRKRERTCFFLWFCLSPSSFYDFLLNIAPTNSLLKSLLNSATAFVC